MRPSGSYKITTTGPLDQDLQRSFILCSWAVQRVLHENKFPFEPFDCHLHFPLDRIQGSGVSCRLSFAYALMEVLGVKLPFPASATVMTGDLNLQGDVLPVGGIAHKIEAARIAGFENFIVAKQQPEASSFMIQIHHLKDLIRSGRHEVDTW
ncbi:S16 family serine protease [Bacillus pseudomycoides]|uniref:S16 family serine protease n=1 Tax=Bacillus bingmayongensis TaxID=1150157 RepID=A0ABU5JYV8_9BACI|nr:S16 family serine protease [Bacillus pseudomycoides]